MKLAFNVEQLRVGDEWAFARVEPIRTDGRAIDYSTTEYAEQVEAGVFDVLGEGLLRRSGEGWKLLEWRFGISDTEVELWRERYRFPRTLLE